MLFSACGGMGTEATVVIKKIANVFATKLGESYIWQGGDLDEMPSGLLIGQVCHQMYPWFSHDMPQIATYTSGLGVGRTAMAA